MKSLLDIYHKPETPEQTAIRVLAYMVEKLKQDIRKHNEIITDTSEV